MPKNDIWAIAIAALGRRAAAGMSYPRDDAQSPSRRIYLPRLLPIGPSEVDDPGVETARRIVQRLAAALRSERARGRAGHWTYDINRHIALRQAYAAERRRLVQLTGAKLPKR